MNAVAAIGNASWLAASLPEYRRFRRDAGNLERVQRNRLAHYLKQNAQTAFGIEHDFASLRSWEAFSQRVPARNYDEFAAWVSRVASGEARVLTSDPVRMFEPSSGSSGPAKWIPYTRTMQREIRRAVAVWSAQTFLSQPELLAGRAYWSLTPQFDTPQSDDSVIPVGFDEDSAYLGGITRFLINRTMATHPALRQVTDMDAFWRLTLLMLLQCPDLRMISVWHPSYLSLLVRRLRADWPSLLQDLESGQVISGPGLQIRRNPRRARELASLGCDDLQAVWPNLRLISCWADGHAAAGVPALRSLFPEAAIQEKGLVATEAFVTVPFANLKPLAIRSHVFEFMDEDDRSHAPWQLERGAIYTVVVTTGGGLYRYRLGDRVEVDNFFGEVPCLRFLGKEDQVADFFGEKLNEDFVAAALRKLFDDIGVHPDFALLALEETLSPAAYVLYVETESTVPDSVAQRLDYELRRNPHYDLCVRLGQLGDVQVVQVHGNAFDRYTERMSDLGVRLGDIKPTPLSRHSGWHRHFRVDS